MRSRHVRPSRDTVRAREIDFERGTFAQLAVDVDKPAMAADDAEGGGQAEAGAFGEFLGGEKRVENLVEILRWNAATGVGHVQTNVTARRDALLDRFVLGIDHQCFRRKGNLSAIGHGIA